MRSIRLTKRIAKRIYDRIAVRNENGEQREKIAVALALSEEVERVDQIQRQPTKCVRPNE